LTSRIINIWSSWDDWADLWDRLRAAEMPVQLAGDIELGAVFPQ